MLLRVQKYINRKEILTVYDDWDLSEKDFLGNQADLLHEDLIQITFRGGYTIDIGWYPEHNLDGSFNCFLIRNQDWANPIYKFELGTISEVEDWVDEMIECVLDFDLKH